jgi:hypothetical protein
MEVSGQLEAPADSPFPPGKEPTILTGCKAEWAIEPDWTLWSREKSLGSAGDRIWLSSL